MDESADARAHEQALARMLGESFDPADEDAVLQVPQAAAAFPTLHCDRWCVLRVLDSRPPARCMYPRHRMDQWHRAQELDALEEEALAAEVATLPDAPTVPADKPVLEEEQLDLPAAPTHHVPAATALETRVAEPAS